MASSTIKNMSYCPATQSLKVAFHSGSTYLYRNVPPEEHEAFKSAESLGKHHAAHIKGKYPCERMPDVNSTHCQICKGELQDGERSEQWFDGQGHWIGWAHSACVDLKEKDEV